MRIGLIARADDGGLGQVTAEFYRHMSPDRTLIIDLGDRGRGAAHPERYAGPSVFWNRGMDSDIAEDLVALFCHGLDVVYSAETFYRSDFADLARAEGCRTVLHAMPELWRADMSSPDAVWVPTDWELDRMPPGTRVVPVPVARDRLPYRAPEALRTHPLTFLHVAAPAMADRNGSRLVVDAIPHVREPCHVIFQGGEKPPPINTDMVTIEHRPSAAAEYWDVYPEDADVLLLPRRYAGLSLPMQEAASRGMPIVSLDLEPQRQWLPHYLTVPAWVIRPMAMVGGHFPVHDAEPGHVAAVMDRLSRDRGLLDQASHVMNRHAETLSWEYWTSRYADELASVVGTLAR